MKINSLVHNTIAVCLCLLFFIVAFIWIAFHFNDSTSAFKDSLDIGASFFSAIATLAAAYIASTLFNDWREQHNKNIEAQFSKEIMDLACESNYQLLQALNIIERHIQNIDEPSEDHFKIAFQNLVMVRDSLVSIICPKIKLIVSDDDYKNLFFPLLDQTTEKLEIYIN